MTARLIAMEHQETRPMAGHRDDAPSGSLHAASSAAPNPVAPRGPDVF